MNMRFFLLLLFEIYFSDLYCQKVRQSNNVSSYFDHVTPIESERRCIINDSLKKEVEFFFVGGFNDTLEVVFDNKIIFNSYLKSELSTSYTGISLSLDYERAHLKKRYIELKNKNVSFYAKIKINSGYRYMRITKEKNDISVSYSNYNCVVYD